MTISIQINRSFSQSIHCIDSVTIWSKYGRMDYIFAIKMFITVPKWRYILRLEEFRKFYLMWNWHQKLIIFTVTIHYISMITIFDKWLSSRDYSIWYHQNVHELMPKWSFENTVIRGIPLNFFELCEIVHLLRTFYDSLYTISRSIIFTK